MNIVDYILLALLLVMVIIGSKKGLIRELAALLTLLPAVIISINLMDYTSVLLYDRIGGSPLVVVFLSFVLLLGLTYVVFKLMAMGIARIAHIQKKGRTDQMGGAFIGFIRGWIVMSFLFFLLFLLPMPATFYVKVGDSLFGPTLIKTTPLLYESTAMFHPKNPSFYNKVESALRLKAAQSKVSGEDEQEVDLVLTQIQRFFEAGPR